MYILHSRNCVLHACPSSWTSCPISTMDEPQTFTFSICGLVFLWAWRFSAPQLMQWLAWSVRGAERAHTGPCRAETHRTWPASPPARPLRILRVSCRRCCRHRDHGRRRQRKLRWLVRRMSPSETTSIYDHCRFPNWSDSCNWDRKHRLT